MFKRQTVQMLWNMVKHVWVRQTVQMLWVKHV